MTATNLSSSNLATIVHKITSNGKKHTISINNAFPSTMSSSAFTKAQDYLDIDAGGVQNKGNVITGKTYSYYSYFGSVKLTVGSTTTRWATWTIDGTTCGWRDTTDTSATLKQAGSYTPGPLKYS